MCKLAGPAPSARAPQLVREEPSHLYGGESAPCPGCLAFLPFAVKCLKGARGCVVMEHASMKTSRRQFVKAILFGGLAAALPLSAAGAEGPRSGARSLNPRYARLDEILKQPVLKRELFKTPVIIETLELLRYKDSFLCRVRSRDGAEGLSVGHSGLNALYPIFIHNLQRFFIGKDARDLDLLLEKVFVYGLNFRYNGISIGTPLATIEFAIIYLLGRLASKSIGDLIGDIHRREVTVYQATEYREKSVEASLEQ